MTQIRALVRTHALLASLLLGVLVAVPLGAVAQPFIPSGGSTDQYPTLDNVYDGGSTIDVDSSDLEITLSAADLVVDGTESARFGPVTPLADFTVDADGIDIDAGGLLALAADDATLTCGDDWTVTVADDLAVTAGDAVGITSTSGDVTLTGGEVRAVGGLTVTGGSITGSAAISGGSITGITDLAVADGGTGCSDATCARAALDVEIGVDVCAYDADGAAYDALSTTGLVARTGAGTVATRTLQDVTGVLAWTNPAGIAGNPTPDFDADIDALALGNALSTLVVPQSTTCSQTTEGALCEDTDDDVLTVGTGSATRSVGRTWVVEYFSSTTIAAPSGTTGLELCDFCVWGPGGPGGSGAKEPSGTLSGGGGGGGAAGVACMYRKPLSTFVGEVLTLGAQGSVGAAVTTDSTPGNAAVDGASTMLGSILLGQAGAGGNGGTASAGGTGGSARPPDPLGTGTGATAGGGGAGGTTAAGTIGRYGYWMTGGGGGGGGGVSTVPAFSAGGRGGGGWDGIFTAQAATEGAAGANGAGDAGGGGAGAGSAVGAGGAGGNGLRHGAGGGGGGASLNGASRNSGAGGQGAPSEALMVCRGFLMFLAAPLLARFPKRRKSANNASHYRKREAA